MRIEDGIKLDFDDVLIKPKRSAISSRSSVNLIREYTMSLPNNHRIKWTGIPIIAANMYGTGTMAMAKALAKHNLATALHKHYTYDELLNFFKDNNWYGMGSDSFSLRIFYTIGTNIEEMAKLRILAKELRQIQQVKSDRALEDQNLELGEKTFFPKPISERIFTFPYMLCVDVANGYTENFLDRIKQIREEFPYSILMAGNVVSYGMTEALILAGVNIVKIGIGPGSCCETRLKTGIGYPQLSAIEECKDAAHGLGGLICADGGCRVPADVCKAFGVGADFVMLGGMFAGTDECEGEWGYLPEFSDGCTDIVWNDGDDVNRPSSIKCKLKFYGMSSEEAQKKHNGGLKNYRASEGKCVEVPYKGPIDKVVQDILGSLRSACSYVGAAKLKDFSKCTTFIRINNGRTHNTIFENL